MSESSPRLEETEKENETLARPSGLVQEAGEDELGCGLDGRTDSEGDNRRHDRGNVDDCESDGQSIEDTDEEELYPEQTTKSVGRLLKSELDWLTLKKKKTSSIARSANPQVEVSYVRSHETSRTKRTHQDEMPGFLHIVWVVSNNKSEHSTGEDVCFVSKSQLLSCRESDEHLQAPAAMRAQPPQMLLQTVQYERHVFQRSGAN